jgi:hypothetical protein
MLDEIVDRTSMFDGCADRVLRTRQEGRVRLREPGRPSPFHIPYRI